MYCELLRLDHKEGGFACAIKCVRSNIVKCLGQYRTTATKADWAGNALQRAMRNIFQPICRDERKSKQKKVELQRKNAGFAAENINVTWSYAIFVLSKH